MHGREEHEVYAAIRCYRVNADGCDEVIGEIRESFGPLIERVPGYLAYYVLDAGGGRFATVSIFQGQAGVKDSRRMAAKWMAQYLTERILAQGRIPSFLLEVEETIEGPLYAGGAKRVSEQDGKPQDSAGLRLLTVEEVREELGMGKTWVYRQIRSGDIPCVKLGRSIKVRRADLDEYLKSRAHR